MSRAASKLQAPEIESGIVTNVNLSRFTVDIATQYTYRRYLDIPWSSPYLHQFSGEGISVMPEVGCPVWTCKSSEPDARPFVMGFGGVWDQKGTFRAGRPSMNPGDIYIATRDRNCVFLRRGGIVQIQATPLAQRMYIPIGNLIRDICESYALHSFAGDLLWEVDRDETTTTGDRPTRVRMLAKEKADDEHPVAQLIMGDHSLGETALSLEIFSDGGDNRAVNASLKIQKDGKVVWDIQGDWDSTVKGDWTVTSTEGAVTLKSSTSTALVDASRGITLRSQGTVVVRSPRFQAGSGGSIIDAVTTGAGKLTLCQGASPLVKGDVLKVILGDLLVALAAYVPVDPVTTANLKKAASAGTALLETLTSKQVFTG